MSQLIIKYLLRLSLNHPRKVYAIMLFLVVTCTAMISLLSIDTDPENMLREDDPARTFQIYAAKGFEGELLEQVQVITAYRDHWVDVMMKEELNMIEETKSPFKMGLVTYIAFILIGLIPLTVYVWDYFQPINANRFLLTSIFTGIHLYGYWLYVYWFSKNLRYRNQNMERGSGNFNFRGYCCTGFLLCG
ncbi:VIT1/CCC1 transporter family protein [Parendozoicomonas sp. Alg238-R29]|uniref:VIT1/CCC1 transporter family protein n=1 Tax=Parendozoicomonas sp. Alg238-R29 TaxID=2993446 RepID=UPI00248E9E3B|nr:VIT1/CCC1 transporter family protein [Parendozoicomonas sp. Alg238-R29]